MSTSQPWLTMVRDSVAAEPADPHRSRRAAEQDPSTGARLPSLLLEYLSRLRLGTTWSRSHRGSCGGEPVRLEVLRRWALQRRRLYRQRSGSSQSICPEDERHTADPAFFADHPGLGKRSKSPEKILLLTTRALPMNSTESPKGCLRNGGLERGRRTSAPPNASHGG